MPITPKLQKHLGCKSDKADKRDLHLPKLTHLGVNAPLPSHTDTFAGLHLPIYNQGDLGSCTANSGVLYRRFLAQRFKEISPSDLELSRLFLYYQERKLEGTTSEDAGACIRDILKVLAKVGVCPEGDDPYNLTQFTSSTVNDNPKDLLDAKLYRIGAYHRVPNINTARSCLASGYAILLGFTVYESFEAIGADGNMPMPNPTRESIIGGHAVVIRGYDDVRRRFYVQNSWGQTWGAEGCLWMPYAFLDDTTLSHPDLWMGHLGHPWKA